MFFRDYKFWIDTLIVSLLFQDLVLTIQCFWHWIAVQVKCAQSSGFVLRKSSYVHLRCQFRYILLRQVSIQRMLFFI